MDRELSPKGTDACPAHLTFNFCSRWIISSAEVRIGKGWLPRDNPISYSSNLLPEEVTATYEPEIAEIFLRGN